MGKKRSRPSVIVPYHVYHFKDMFKEFDFVCLEDIKREGSDNYYKVMMLNYSTAFTASTIGFGKDEQYQCGDITGWWIRVGDVRFIEKSAYTDNAIKLAKLITM